MENKFLDLNYISSRTGEPVNQAPAPGTTETIETSASEAPEAAAADTSEAPAEIISTTPATTPAPAASETPVPTSAPALSEAPATAASENPTPAPANPDQPDTAVDVRRQRVEELKKSLTSGSVATPTPGATKATPATSKTSPATASPGTLPADYLTGGYRKGEGKESYPNPALVDQAEIIGKALAAGGVTPTAINRMIRTLKDTKKLPFDAQQGAMKKLLPLALKEKKPLLREVVEHNQAAVKNELDFVACLEHFRDIAVFLEANVTKK